MTTRTVVGDMLKDARPTFQPTARAVDTFVKPAKAPETKSDALLKAMASLDQAFNPALRKGAKRAADGLRSKGEQLYQQNRKDFADAVRDGDIPFGASPFVKKGYRRAMLHTLGATYGTELNRALEQSNLHELSDPSEVESFIQAFNEDFHKDNNLEGIQDRELSQYYTPMVQQANDGFRRKQANENIKFTEDQRFAAFENELLAVISMGRLGEGAQSSAASSAQIGQWLNTKAQELYEEGGDWNYIQRTVIDLVGNIAAEKGSHSILNILDHVEIAGMGRLSKTVDGQKTIRAARNAVAAKQRAASAKANAASKKASKDTITGYETAAIQAAHDGDEEAFNTEYAKLLKTAPAKARAVWNFRRSLNGDAEDATQAGQFAAALLTVRTIGSRDDADEYLDSLGGSGTISWEQTNQLRQVADRSYGDDQKAKGVNQVLKDPALKTLTSGLKSTISGGYEPTDEKRDQAAAVEMAMQDAAISIYQELADEDGQYDQLLMRKRLKEEAALLREIYVAEGTRETTDKLGSLTQQPPDWTN